MAQRVARYIVIRTRDVLGYQEFFGPLASYPDDVAADAERLFGKPGHKVSWVPWSTANPVYKALLDRDNKERGGSGENQ